MEKYGRWRDHATGLHPFLEPKKEYRSIVGTLIELVFLVVILPIKLALGLVAGILWAASMVSSSARPWAARVTLALLGIVQVEVSGTGPAEALAVFATLGSPLDVLLAAALTGSDQFLFPVSSDSDRCAEVRGVAAAFFQVASLRPPSASQLQAAKPLASFLRDVKPGSPVPVVFAEGATSNGQILLRTPPLLAAGSLPVGKKVATLASKYAVPSEKSASPYFAFGSLQSKLLSWLATPMASVKVDWATLSAPISMEHVSWEWRRVLGIRQAVVSAWDKNEFLLFYEKSHSTSDYANKKN